MMVKSIIEITYATIKVYEYISMVFCQLFKGRNLCDFLIAFSKKRSLLKMGSAVKGKNLLLQEQILSYNS